MFLKRSLIAASITLAALTGCNSNNANPEYSAARFATYNLSFDRATYEILANEMSMSRTEQSNLINMFHQSPEKLTEDQKTTAKRIIQIRNVTETIQRVRPNAFVLAEFNNDGTGEDMTAINGFHDNYLAYSQNDQRPISFMFKKNIATNTGKASGFDLDRDGKKTDVNNDAWGFGGYHGQYAFAIFSQFEIDEKNVRTFQNFKWKDMPGEKNITIVDCKLSKTGCPTGMKEGDAWYTDEAWQQMPLSSKNHVDVPLVIPTPAGNEVIHFLVSHPAPPIFNNVANHNYEHNRAELKFWNDYINAQSYFYDDNGKTGGLTVGSKFVIAGDMNADAMKGDGDRRMIADLLKSHYVNTDATIGSYAPSSKGGQECFDLGHCKAENSNTPYPEAITSVSGLRLDYVIPSANLAVNNSGVFFPSSSEDGYHLVYDKDLGASKGVTSDHRMVWVDLDLTK
ncbi:endonuclease/exonuclease/phosphatase family protein [Photobacterium sanguinicancri]|uniref:Endonuclease/exonuclease/phosphatase family protein n=1 Tax=Photobacterium sanguinicancri TaxID=875932 RepID=A0AAW7XY61_9GAMM|nr:endonuclease/exonuclease/phosphatase family protein [Photobacterium sanguinicancri]MDO6541074.1 endonuclease/exonuclease/phosphatase family protein [Photobacterium sanguinicancri]